MKGSPSILLQRVVMAFIEEELFHNRRRNITIYERLYVDFIAGSRDGIY
jgi:hypothetical protein